MARVSPVYATIDDLAICGVPPDALRDIEDAAKNAALAQASDTADMKLAARYRLPLTAWSDDLKQIVCMIAAYRLLVFGGWMPSDPSSGGIVALYKEATQTLTDVAMGRASLNVIDTSPDPVFVPDMITDDLRGW